jgi:DNA-binding transcriptional regulator YdaS (Cro superfamily)
MDLRSYRKHASFGSIARATGVTTTTISLIASGKRTPSAALASRIELACGGHVRATELRRVSDPSSRPIEPRASRELPAVDARNPADNGHDCAADSVSERDESDQTNDATRLSVSAERRP